MERVNKSSFFQLSFVGQPGRHSSAEAVRFYRGEDRRVIQQMLEVLLEARGTCLLCARPGAAESEMISFTWRLTAEAKVRGGPEHRGKICLSPGGQAQHIIVTAQVGGNDQRYQMLLSCPMTEMEKLGLWKGFFEHLQAGVTVAEQKLQELIGQPTNGKHDAQLEQVDPQTQSPVTIQPGVDASAVATDALPADFAEAVGNRARLVRTQVVYYKLSPVASVLANKGKLELILLAIGVNADLPRGLTSSGWYQIFSDALAAHGESGSYYTACHWATRAIEKLVERGLVDRRPIAGNRFTLALTEAGRLLVSPALPAPVAPTLVQQVAAVREAAMPWLSQRRRLQECRGALAEARSAAERLERECAKLAGQLASTEAQQGLALYDAIATALEAQA